MEKMLTWTNEDIEAILIQLNNMGLPFKKYEFSRLGEGMTFLGSGSSANVYEAVRKGKKNAEYAIKVIGFGRKHVDSKAFQESVESQKDLGSYENNIVKIYDSIEIKVWIKGEHEVVKAEKIDQYNESGFRDNCLHLQFVLMEKVSPVLSKNGFKNEVTPYKLGIYDEKEILKLAYEIGTAINCSHKNNLIHRDIKPENIFYDYKKEHYKLGDFGIARTTDDGMASTVAFTKGYGAPEVVGTLEDKYDYTADIYSFGMLLYIFMNDIKFPDSDNYRPNLNQYTQGYVPPEPINGSDELARIVLKMISFNPDDRYQSMEEVLNEFDKLKFGHKIKYQREHKSISLVLGASFALTGSIVWKLSFMPNVMFNFSALTYFFCFLCIVKLGLYLLKKETKYVGIAIFGIGTFLIYDTNFMWWKLLLLVVALVINDYWIGIAGGCAIIVNTTYLFMKANSIYVISFEEYRWIAVLLLSLSVLLLFVNDILGQREDTLIKIYIGKNTIWTVATIYYAILFLIGMGIDYTQRISRSVYDNIISEDKIKWMLSWNPKLVGMCGVIFCVGWIVRERFLVFGERIRDKKIEAL